MQALSFLFLARRERPPLLSHWVEIGVHARFSTTLVHGILLFWQLCSLSEEQTPLYDDRKSTMHAFYDEWARELWKTKVYQSPNKESSHTLPLTFMTGWDFLTMQIRNELSNSQLNMMPQINLGPGELVAERRKDLTLRTPEEACERDIKWIPPMARNSWTRKGRPDITYARKTWNTSQLRAMKWIKKITLKSQTFWITACGTSHKERRMKGSWIRSCDVKVLS